MSYLCREDLVPLCIPVWRNMWPFYGTLLAGKKILKASFNLTLQPQGETQGKSRIFLLRGVVSPQPGEQGILVSALHADDWNFTSPIEPACPTWPVELGTSCLQRVMCRADVPIQMFSPKCLFPPHTPSKQPANALAFQEKKNKSVFHAWQISPGGAISAVLVVCIMNLFWASSSVPTSTPVIAWELRWVK